MHEQGLRVISLKWFRIQYGKCNGGFYSKLLMADKI